IEGGAEIAAAEHVGLEVLERADGGIANAAAHERDLAEEIAGREEGGLALGLARVRNIGGGAACADEEELVAGVALAHDDFTLRVAALGHALCVLGYRDRREPVEQLDGLQELADDERLAQRD